MNHTLPKQRETYRALFFSIIIAIFLIAISIIPTGCMSIVRDKNVEIPISCNVPDAVASYGPQKIITPGVLNIPRNQDCIVKVSKEGFQEKIIKLETYLNGWAFTGSILLNAPHGFLTVGITEIIGVSCDTGSGVCNDLEPDKIDVVLEKQN